LSRSAPTSASLENSSDPRPILFTDFPRFCVEQRTGGGSAAFTIATEPKSLNYARLALGVHGEPFPKDAAGRPTIVER